MQLFTLTNRNGMVAKITDFGAILNELWVPDKNGKLDNVVLGFENLGDYELKSPHFGATTGRYANRIAGASCVIAGKEYKFPVNDRGKNCLHGGTKGLDKRRWDAQQIESTNGSALKLSYVSADMEEGFPGELHLVVEYTLTHDNAVEITYIATTDKPTVLNLTNHSYFNLSGAHSGTILDTELWLDADSYTPVNEDLIPTGAIDPVKDTPYDFSTPTRIGERIDQIAPGYDVNYVLKHQEFELALSASAVDPKSGRKLEMFTTEPGVQLYSGQYLEEPVRGFKGPFPKYGAFCLEAQHFPDSPNQPQFPSTLYTPDRAYIQTTIYKFSNV
ncbi:MAG TPA: aldose epimerase family protein [Planktothrix sp.]|jgi:aldose 1-epimerase